MNNKNNMTTKSKIKVKNNKVTKYTRSTGNTAVYAKITKGVYQTSLDTYTVRKTINGKRIMVAFKNKAKAIKFYKSL